jgi:hypothetical protein
MSFIILDLTLKKRKKRYAIPAERSATIQFETSILSHLGFVQPAQIKKNKVSRKEITIRIPHQVLYHPGFD